MKIITPTLHLSLSVLLLIGCASVAAAQEPASLIRGTKWMALDQEQETRLALSAAPEHVSRDAGVWLLRKGGYEQARESKNGFNCFVQRWISNPRLYADDRAMVPICYDAEGSRSLFQADLRRVKLAEQGKSLEEIEKIVAEEYRTGKIPVPKRGGIAFMMATQTVHNHKTDSTDKVFPPHLMFYAPYVKNSDIGAKPEDFASHRRPFVLNEGKPDAMILVVMQPCPDCRVKAKGDY